MSRWFRHYAGMMRDEKLVRVALRSKQSIERVLWVWGAILESAAEINDAGRYDFDAAEAAYFLRADLADLEAIEASLADCGRVCEGRVVNWGQRQFASDSSTERVRRHRGKQQSEGESHNEPSENVTESFSNGDVTFRNAPETETYTETEKKEDSLSEPSSDAPKRKRNSYPEEFEGFWSEYPTDPLMSKKQAFDAWKRLTPEDRAKARSAVPAFSDHCRNNPDYRPLHAVRFLSQRRFDGFATTVSSRPPPGLGPEERAKWVREQMEAEREKANGGTGESSGAVLDRSDRFRAA